MPGRGPRRPQRRLAATRWPDKETVADQSQGVQLATLQELVRYWATDYDWRKGEAKLNALPQFIRRSTAWTSTSSTSVRRHPNAMPLIITHGWPGSVFEQIKLIGPLTDPTTYRRPSGGCVRRRDPVDARLRFLGATDRGRLGVWNASAARGIVLMKRLGYTRYVAQGGDWGAGVVEAMGRQAPTGLLGIHTNLPAVVTDEVGAALGGDKAALAAFTEKERSAISDLGGYLQAEAWPTWS